MKAYRYSLWRISNHELYRSVRTISQDLPRLEIIRLLIDERSKCLAKFIQGLAISLAATLFIRTNLSEELVSISIYSFKLEIPAIFISIFSSVMLSGSLINAFSYFQINELYRRSVNLLYRFDNSSALATYYSGADAWTIGVVPQFRFISSGITHIIFIVISLIFALVPVMLIVIYVGYSVFYISVFIIFFSIYEIYSMYTLLSVISIFVVLYPISWIAMQIVPIKFNRNTKFIRWSFLTPIYKRNGAWPPLVGKWI